MTGGGYLAGRWSGSARALRRAGLGALAGGLAGTFIFCLWGAATAGSARWISTANETPSLIESMDVIVRLTMGMFLVLFLGGGGLGALGGLVYRFAAEKMKRKCFIKPNRKWR